MTSAADHQSYGNPNRRPGGPGSPWGNDFWGMLPPWFPSPLVKPLLIVGMIAGFIFFWPIGLLLLGFLIWRRQMWCHSYRRYGGAWGWQDGRPANGPGPWNGWKNWAPGGGTPASSGNRAFDEYRAETLRRLEQEQKDFGDFLDRLRFAKDKSEFDQFMTERRNGSNAPPPPPEHPAQS